jgi:hypothetical protein
MNFILQGPDHVAAFVYASTIAVNRGFLDCLSEKPLKLYRFAQGNSIHGVSTPW